MTPTRDTKTTPTPRATLDAVTGEAAIRRTCRTATGAALDALARTGDRFVTFVLTPPPGVGEFPAAVLDAAHALAEPLARLAWLAGKDREYVGPVTTRDSIILHAPIGAARPLLDALLGLDIYDTGQADALAPVVAPIVAPVESMLDSRRAGRPRAHRALLSEITTAALAAVAEVEAAIAAVSA